MMNEISAERIFYKVLRDCKGNSFMADPVTLHKAFYDMCLSNQGLMQAFDFIVRINPYSPKLEELIFYYQLCGILSRDNPEYVNYRIKRDRLDKICSEDVDSIKLEKPESLIAIFG
jgi:hypothetical protein